MVPPPSSWPATWPDRVRPRVIGGRAAGPDAGARPLVRALRWVAEPIFFAVSDCVSSYAVGNALYWSLVRGSEVRTDEGPVSLPGLGIGAGGLVRIRRGFSVAPLIVKILMVAALVFFFPAVVGILVVAALVYAPFAVSAAHRSVVASLSVAVWGLAVVTGLSGGYQPWLALLLLLPFAVGAAGQAGGLGRWFVPCRTVGWALAWAVPVGILAWRLARSQPAIGPAAGWLIACVVLGWRLAKSLQEEREFGRQQARGGALAAPYGWPSSREPREGNGAGATTRPRPAPPGAGTPPGGGTGPAGRRPRGNGRIAAAAEAVRAQHAAEGSQPPLDAAHDRAAARPPEITVDEAMAELDNMIGLTAVKAQVRSIAASIEAARRRAVAGYATDKPMQHVVFLGPPGTGKTAVARIIAKIFYAFGLLETPTVLEAQRADLVGEYLGATAIKTNELIDAALGGVLFIDEAYSLVNDGEGHADRFGKEAVQALLRRAEDDRDNLIVILAGYQRQMEDFLASNPALNPGFPVRIRFPGYSPAELVALTQAALAQHEESLDGEAVHVLTRM